MHKSISNSAEIQLYFKSNCSKSKKALAYAKSLSGKVNTINIGKNNSTGTIWRSILAKLNKSPKDLLDKSNPYYQENIRGRDFEDRDWTNLLMNNPDLVRSPFVIRGNKALILDNPTDIFRI
ncbi:MAG: glutaredoxin [Bacteroidia bacterium]|nr:glutaredoxin [Bacteroidia bacterium]